MTIVERLGGLSATGVAKEATFGTPVTPTSYIPFATDSIEPDPGLFYPELVSNSRQKNIFAGYGQQKFTGAIEFPLFPTMGTDLLVGAIGLDTQPGYGITIVNPSATSTTITAGSIAGATTITVASVTGISVGSIIQLDVNASTTTAEVFEVSLITGLTLTLDHAALYPHTSGVTVIVGQASSLYRHSVVPNNTLNSFTIERNIGNYQSQQYAGCRVNKMGLKVPATDAEASLTCDIIAQSTTSLANPSSPITTVNEPIYTFNLLSLNQNTSVGGAAVQIPQANNLEINIDNGLVATYTFNNTHNLEFLTPGALVVNGTFDVIWSSLTDPNFGYFNNLFAAANNYGTLTAELSQGTNLSSMTLTLFNVRWSKLTDEIKLGDVIKSTVSFEAALNLGEIANAPATNIELELVNSRYLPY